MEVEIGIPGFLKIRDQKPSPFEIVRHMGKPSGNPIKDLGKLMRYVSDYSQAGQKRELTGTITTIIQERDER